jgi:dihydroorotase
VRPILIRGGRVIDPSRGTDGIADVYLEEGKVTSVGRGMGMPDDALTIDAQGKIVTPGFIDLHVHLREPGQEDLETVATGAMAAAAGGFSAVCAMPNTDPVTDNQAAVGFIVSQAQRAGKARVYPIGAISLGQKGQQLAEFGELVGAGAIAVSDDGKPVVSSHLMRTALEYARTFGIPVADHCEDPTLASGGAMHEGLVSTRLGLKGIPSAAEEIMVARDILLAEHTGGHIHLCHMSTRGSVELIRRAKEKGLRVTAEACPHHFTLTHEACEGYDTNAKMNPPLREPEDREALRLGLRDGTIDAICTDHAPHHYDAKEREFDDTRAVNYRAGGDGCPDSLRPGGAYEHRTGTDLQLARWDAGPGRAGGRDHHRPQGTLDRHPGRVLLPKQEHSVFRPEADGQSRADDRARTDRLSAGALSHSARLKVWLRWIC